MTERSEDRLEEGRKRLADIQQRLERYMPRIKVREGAKRSEWRSDKVARTHPRASKKGRK
jgi:hypothetical protein